MRIEDEKKLSGYFWLPSEPERKLPGVLKVSDGGDIELEVVGNFDKDLTRLQSDFNIQRILGHVEKEHFVTLDHCFYRKKGIPLGNIAISNILVHRMYSGVLYEENEPVVFDSFRFSIEGLDEWLSITGIKLEFDTSYSKIQIEYNPPEEECAKIDDVFNIKFTFGWTSPGLPIITEAKITQTSYIELSSNTPQAIDDFISLANKLTNFICFAVDATVSIKHASAKYSEIKNEFKKGEFYSVPIGIIYPSLPFTDSPQKVVWHTMLFRYPQVKEKFELILRGWLKAYEIIEPAMNLYFGSKTGAYRFIDGKFLSLAQCLETFHRRTSAEVMMPQREYKQLVSELINKCPDDRKDWLKSRLIFGNEISLRNRLKKVMQPFKSYIGDQKNCNKLINMIVDTRNYLTHYTDNLQNKACNGAELYSLCMKMEAIFQLQLMDFIGLSNEQITQIAWDNRQIKYKLNEA